MANHFPDELDRQLDRFERRLPVRFVRIVRWMRRPSSTIVRIPVAVLLIGGGMLSFLPVFGLWMLPLGLVLIAQDVSILRPPLARLLAWIERRWPAKEQSAGADSR
jgi:hypothetical protein